jgi:hypothetical protein
MGRPKKGQEKKFSDLPDNWNEIIEDGMGAGATKAMMYKKLGISRRVAERFRNEHDEFDEAFSWGETLAEAMLDERLIKILMGEVEANRQVLTALIFDMKSRFQRYDRPIPEKHAGAAEEKRQKEFEAAKENFIKAYFQKTGEPGDMKVEIN